MHAGASVRSPTHISVLARGLLRVVHGSHKGLQLLTASQVLQLHLVEHFHWAETRGLRSSGVVALGGCLHDVREFDVVQVNSLSVLYAIPSLFLADCSVVAFRFQLVHRDYRTASNGNSAVTLDGLRWAQENVFFDGVQLNVEQIVERELSVSIDQTVKFDHNLFDCFALQLSIVGHAVVPQVEKPV